MATRSGFKYNHQNRRLELYVNGTVVDYFDESMGNTYYVNMLTGNDSNDGLSWSSAFAQVNAAIIASEASRKAKFYSSGTLQGARYQTMRNRIIIYGCGTSGALYDPILYTTNLVDPHHCDIFGIGDLPFADGDGTVHIGSTTTATIGFHTSTNTGSGEPGMFGTNFYNIMFRGGGGTTYYAVEFGKVRGDGFYDCAFTHNSGTGAAAGCIGADEMFAGMVFDGCQFRSEGGSSTTLLNVGSGVCAWTDIRNCVFQAAGADTCTNAIKWAGGSSSSMVRNCIFQGVFTVAVADTSTYGLGLWGNLFGTGSVDTYTATQSRNYGGNVTANAFLAV
jgi:hypothetical protein